MTYLLSIGVSSCVCFQRVVTRACVALSRSLSVCRAVCVEGDVRDNRTVCFCKYSLEGQTPRKTMNASFISYILTIYEP